MHKLPSVLLVDDDETKNFLNAHLLKSLGVTDQVLVAHNGQEALSLLARHCTPPAATCPMLVLLDINMPVMAGIDFLEARVAILTTSMHPRDLERLEQLPHIALLHKPLTREKINILLQEHFQRQLSAD